MFPIRDHNPATRRPYVNYALIIANVVIFVSYLPISTDMMALTAFYDTWAIVPDEVSSGHDVHALVSSMFLHGGWMHLLGNMLFLYIFGDNVEDLLGHLGYAAFYFASGIGAGALQVVADPGSVIPVVGASGAIAGVMGGYLLLFPRARIDILIFLIVIVRIISVPAWMMLGLWFGMQVVNGASSPAGTGGVAYWAHAGGFVTGMILLVPVWLRRGGVSFWRRTHGVPDHPEAHYRHIKSDVPNVPRAPRPPKPPAPKAPGAVPVIRRRR